MIKLGLIYGPMDGFLSISWTQKQKLSVQPGLKIKSYSRQINSVAERTFALLTADLGSIPSSIYGPLAIANSDRASTKP